MPRIGDGKETSFSPVKISKRSEQRRSKRDKLKDEVIADIERRIDEIEGRHMERDRLNDMDTRMVLLLRDQIITINKLCEKKG